jgi:hypothetical protein
MHIKTKKGGKDSPRGIALMIDQAIIFSASVGV